jgi:hypothetical protein
MESSPDMFAGLGMILLVLLMLGVGLVALAFWIWMLVHAIKNPGLSDSERIVWVLVIIFVQLLGAIIYYFVGKPKQPGGP